MVTVFSTVLPLVLRPAGTPEDLFALCRRAPLARLASALDLLADTRLEGDWAAILDVYEDFLTWKEDDDVEHHLEGGELKETVRQHAERLSIFLHSALTHSKIPGELRRYLVL